MEREQVLHGKTYKIRTGCGNMYVTINFDEGKPVEVFARLGKAGGCASSQTEAIGRLVSVALKYNVPIDLITKQLSNIGCHLPSLWGPDGKVLSCSDAISKCLLNIAEKKIDESDSIVRRHIVNYSSCPECGGPTAIEEGCEKCHSCGFTKCG